MENFKLFETSFYFNSAIKFLNEKMLKPWLTPPLIYFSSGYWTTSELIKSVYEFVDMLTKDLEESFQAKSKTNEKSMNYLTQLYKIRDTMSYKEIRNEVIVTTFAGFDTTGNSISGILLCLAMHPDVQDKVVAELNEIFLDNDDDELDEEKMSKMIYLEMVAKEAMRLFPVNPMFGRRAAADVELSNFV